MLTCIISRSFSYGSRSIHVYLILPFGAKMCTAIASIVNLQRGRCNALRQTRLWPHLTRDTRGR